MKLKLAGIENEIDFSNNINVIEIVDKRFFKAFLMELNEIISSGSTSDKLLLIKDGESKSLSKHVMLLFDIFNIDFNSKTILSKLYCELNNIVVLDDRVDNEYENLIQELLKYVREKTYEMPFECKIDDKISFKDILKTVSLKIDVNSYVKLEEKLMFLIDIISEFKLVDILMIANLKTYFSNEEIEEIYKYAICKNVKILLIENTNSQPMLLYENKLIIDDEFDDFLIQA